MAILKCPVPNCTYTTNGRQTHINAHVRKQHCKDLEKGIGGDMPALRERQQDQFSHWLRKNGYPNVSLFVDGSFGRRDAHSLQIDNDDKDDDEDEENQDDVKQQPRRYNKTAKTAVARVKANTHRRIHETDGIVDLLRMIETTDESGLGILPQHTDDTHTIVREDGILSEADRKPSILDDDQA